MNDNFEINDWVKITMKNKSVICGQVKSTRIFRNRMHRLSSFLL